jgi:outer membrane receptor protein involved in Fe transport
MRVGFNGTLASGRPISCIGFVPPTAADFDDAAGYSTASSFYCLNEQTKLAELHNRGTFGRTPWSSSVDLSFAYLPKMAKGRLTLQLDVFNVFNQRQTTEVSEVRDFSRGTSNATDPGKNQLDLNWKSPTSFQEPRSIRMTARYEF